MTATEAHAGLENAATAFGLLLDAAEEQMEEAACGARRQN
jgi:hypothetical protein